MPQKKFKRRSTDPAQIIGAIIFITLLLGLIILGIVYESGTQFEGKFFDDVGNAIKWK